jgi:hypothetical protein
MSERDSWDYQDRPTPREIVVCFAGVIGSILAAMVVVWMLAGHARAEQPATIDSQVNADMAAVSSAQTKVMATMDNWRSAIITLSTQRDNLNAQVSVLTKERDDAKAELAKLKPAEEKK